MVHLYDYKIKNLYSFDDMVKKPQNWYENKSVSAFLNLIPKNFTGNNELKTEKKKKYIISKTIRYIYIKLTYLLYFIFNTPSDTYYNQYFNSLSHLDKNKFKVIGVTEVFKPCLFFYIRNLIPQTDEDDIHKEGETKIKSEKIDKKHKIKFLEECGLLPKLVLPHIPLGIIYNLYGEYLNEVWSLLFDLEKTILTLHLESPNTPNPYDKYLQEEINNTPFSKSTYPTIYNDLDIDITEDKDARFTDTPAPSDVEQKNIIDENIDTHYIYNFTYKNIILNKKDKLWIPNLETNFTEIENEDKLYSDMMNNIMKETFADEYIKKLNKQFEYHKTRMDDREKLNNKFNDEFIPELTNNIKNIGKYLRKYFKLTQKEKETDIKTKITKIKSSDDHMKSLDYIINEIGIIQEYKEKMDLINSTGGSLGFIDLFNTLFTNIKEYSTLSKDLREYLKEDNYYYFFENLNNEDGLTAAQKLDAANLFRNIRDIFNNTPDIFSVDNFNKIIKQLFENKIFDAFNSILDFKKYRTKIEESTDALTKLTTTSNPLQQEKITEYNNLTFDPNEYSTTYDVLIANNKEHEDFTKFVTIYKGV